MNARSAVSFVSALKARSLSFAVFLLFFAGLSLHAFGQEATILGTVTDPSGSVVPNVAVTITNVGTGEARTTSTNGDGQYVVPGLIIGRYNVGAKASGFGGAEQNGIVLNVNDRTRVDFVLKVGALQEQVTVEANAVRVQSDSSDVSTVITGQQVAELGVNGRSVYSLYSLTPGASSLQGDLVIPTPVSGDSNVSVNGQRAGHNLQLLDGSENLDRGGSSASVMPSMDAIAEFRDLTSNYSAEYGLAGAAMITTVVKSGTKTFHASAWEFDRNDALDARNYFNPAPNKVAELRFNVYGFNGGGQVPLFKSHPTFFFYNMEWRSLVQGGLTNQTVPYTSTYGGDFAANLPANSLDSTGAAIPNSGLHVPCANQLSTAQQAAFATAGITTFSTPDASGSCAVNTKTTAALNPIFAPFPASSIPGGLLDGNAQALLKAGIFPGPTSGQQFIGGNNSPTNVREEIARIDHQFTDKFSVFGHWVSEQVSQTYGTTQWSGDNVPTISDVFGNPSYSAVIHTTYVISPSLLNEAAFNYNGNRIHIIPQGVFTAPSGFTFNRLFTGPNVDNRIPSINLNGSTGTDYTANWTPWNNAANDYQLRDDLSWTKGAHQLKFGFSWALYKKVQDYFANTEGNFNFNGNFTGNDFADFLLGYAQQYEEDAVKSSGHWNNVSYAAYVQDNWRATHRLTLNLGLRWDGAPHTYEANHQSANFYPNLYNPANAATFDTAGNICSSAADPGCAAASPGLGGSPNPILAGLSFYENGIGIGGVNGIPKGLTNNYWPAFGPRVGFAYDLTGQGKTVLRGGFGIMYDRIQGNDMYNGATNTPFDASPTVHNVSLSNPGLNVTSGATITAAALPILPVGITGIATNYKPPTSYQYSLGVQQALNNRSVISLSYVGSQGRHENYYQEINLPPAADLPALVASGGSGINQLYGYQGYGGIRLSVDGANAHYNSLQIDLHANVHNDLQLQFGYTLSRAMDATDSNGSGGDLNNVTNPYVGWRYDFGPSLFDRTNVAFVNFVYQIPFLKNSDNHLLRGTVGGWALSGIVTMESGAPLNLGVSGSTVASVIPNDGTSTQQGDRPDVSGSISYPKNAGQWFNPAAFSAPAPGTYGNLGFDALRGPGRDDWNLALLKNFVISAERGSRIEFRAETFNTWNHTQFKGDINNGGISINQGASNFGSVTAAFDPREFQLGLKIIF
ncbi:MAG: TonB-dependent receptor [Candidatus Sulfotelmatobacter sp.]|jgi:Carboxypeptidase regulatory-like domain